MKAGRLRHVLRYQTAASTPDAVGQEQPTWSTAHVWRGEVSTPTGRELLHAQQLKAVADVVIRVRFPGFLPDPTARLVEGESVYNITAAVDPDGYRRTLLIFAERDPQERPE